MITLSVGCVQTNEHASKCARVLKDPKKEDDKTTKYNKRSLVMVIMLVYCAVLTQLASIARWHKLVAKRSARSNCNEEIVLTCPFCHLSMWQRVNLLKTTLFGVGVFAWVKRHRMICPLTGALACPAVATLRQSHTHTNCTTAHQTRTEGAKWNRRQNM